MRYMAALALILVAGCGNDYGLEPQGDVQLAPNETRTVTDGFTQLVHSGPIDVLVVLDGSGSMQDDYENVGLGMLQLKHDIERISDTWSFTFITADPTRLGPQGPYRSGVTTDIDILMGPGLLPVTGGEMGFGAAYTFVRDYPEWFSPDAHLLIFLVSDEDEQSGVTPGLFAEWLRTLKNEGVQADAVSIVSTGLECSPDVGHKYIELSHLLGKQAVDLCEGGWTEWLSELSIITALKSELVLSELPLRDTVEVMLDDVPTDAWSYDSESNTVFFDEAPPPGTVVQVRYLVPA